MKKKKKEDAQVAATSCDEGDEAKVTRQGEGDAL